MHFCDFRSIYLFEYGWNFYFILASDELTIKVSLIEISEIIPMRPLCLRKSKILYDSCTMTNKDAQMVRKTLTDFFLSNDEYSLAVGIKD